jgi:hypothetical protein
MPIHDMVDRFKRISDKLGLFLDFIVELPEANGTFGSFC